MNERVAHGRRKPLIAAGLVVALDQLTKFLAATQLDRWESVRVFGDVVRLTLVRNPGIAFGLRFGEWAQVPLVLLSAAIAVLLAVHLFHHRHAWGRGEIALAAIMGGAVGNLIDRLRFGTVVDFIDIGVGTTRWPVFNVADSAVTVGVLYLLFAQLSSSAESA